MGVSVPLRFVPSPTVFPSRGVRALGQEDPLEKEMTTHFSILAWRMLWTEEHGGLQSRVLQRVSGVIFKLYFFNQNGLTEKMTTPLAE